VTVRARAIAPIAGAALALLAAAAGPAPAARYEVTFRAEMSERWSFEEHASRECSVGRCVRDETGQGTAHVSMATKRPLKIEILRIPGAAPMIDPGGSEGVAVRGSSSRDGEHVTDYSGDWAASNPDVVDSTADCGERPVRAFVSFGWASRRELQVATAFNDLRDACPWSPPQFDWDQPGDPPSIGAVLGAARPAQVGRARQFTVRGTRHWTGTVPAINRTDPDDTLTRFGAVEVTWQWEALFRRVRR
jgi:hypothetical protein